MSVTVGVGIIILRHDGKILVGKRKGKHAQKYAIPGGSIIAGESFAEAVIREAKEETNLVIYNPVVINITNNLETYREEGIHTASITLFTEDFSGELKIMEPDKCEE